MAGTTDSKGVYTGKGGYQYAVVELPDKTQAIGVIRPDGSRTIAERGSAEEAAIMAELRSVMPNAGKPEVGRMPGRSASRSEWSPIPLAAPTTHPVPTDALSLVDDPRYANNPKYDRRLAQIVSPVEALPVIGGALAADPGTTASGYRLPPIVAAELAMPAGVFLAAAGTALAHGADTEMQLREAQDDTRTSNVASIADTSAKNRGIRVQNAEAAKKALHPTPADVVPEPSDEEWADFKNNVTVKNSKKK